MSRSVRKTPKASITISGFNKGESKDKTIARRKYRRKTKLVDIDNPDVPHKLEVSNEWRMAKDGKHRFDPDEFPKGMRK